MSWRRARTSELRTIFCFTLDAFLTISIDETAANDLFTVLVNRDQRLPTMIASQSGPGYWIESLPEKMLPIQS
ncbi:hypothetical protein IV500_03800 [Paeniglutamicibacter antarcticus]|uniref:Uncharacterized protein n=1 Tax=Arthrobacter terrae TaxID=2935737 RepID=A0A931CLV0_9MICC|nr:hypothetical protein [Arthrobacter terrae]MBG0738545.1 hypothetical protein [Arthrobacter terrae]